MAAPPFRRCGFTIFVPSLETLQHVGFHFRRENGTAAQCERLVPVLCSLGLCTKEVLTREVDGVPNYALGCLLSFQATEELIRRMVAAGGATEIPGTGYYRHAFEVPGEPCAYVVRIRALAGRGLKSRKLGESVKGSDILEFAEKMLPGATYQAWQDAYRDELSAVDTQVHTDRAQTYSQLVMSVIRYPWRLRVGKNTAK